MVDEEAENMPQAGPEVGMTFKGQPVPVTLWSVRANLPKFSRKTPNGAIGWRSRAQTTSPSMGDIYHSNHLLVPLQIPSFTLLGDSAEEAVFGAEGFQNNSGRGRGWGRAGDGVCGGRRRI